MRKLLPLIVFAAAVAACGPVDVKPNLNVDLGVGAPGDSGRVIMADELCSACWADTQFLRGECATISYSGQNTLDDGTETGTIAYRVYGELDGEFHCIPRLPA